MTTYQFHDSTTQEVYTRENRRCLFCNKLTEIDEGKLKQVIPKSKGGERHYANTVWCCGYCYNSVRGNTMYNQKAIYYLQSLGLISPLTTHDSQESE